MIGRGGRAVGALAVVAVLAGCGGADADNAAAQGPTEESLRTAAEQMTEALAAGDYPGAYQFRSARCRLTLGQDAYVEEMTQRYAGRDLKAAEPEITVTVTGTTGRVTVRHTDARASEDESAPATWTFVDGSWRYDTC
ncbi:hypothetical protein [Nocardia farcinica]|uniref:hypothetical protein n=1 Tax=Nocardia farcinica TaxID=37329 RepID=UPI000A3CE5A3|nr:hypothetical protein [Nocardia farcinica]MBA4858358.1 hypothetical protein [Nocardia farcinica]MBC9818327.1 hypothetical protein [Nocardia farcinica]MBF6291705.1 hypothetical protein [Nocardia farcinica]MBF6373376.1 hypothetical protein [Nocardia farcinica]MBF6378005.1 hypothetical protein [Nocardia farcinica]